MSKTKSPLIHAQNIVKAGQWGQGDFKIEDSITGKTEYCLVGAVARGREIIDDSKIDLYGLTDGHILISDLEVIVEAIDKRSDDHVASYVVRETRKQLKRLKDHADQGLYIEALVDIIAEWNDHIGTTSDDVLEVLFEAQKIKESSGDV